MNKKWSMSLLCAAILPLSAEVRNGDFSWIGRTPPAQATVEQYRSKGLKCPDAKDWPQWWSYIGNGGEFSFPRTGGHSGIFARITGTSAGLYGYHGLKMNGDFVIEGYFRGDGALYLSFSSYGKNDKGGIIFLSGAKGAKAVAFDLKNQNWERYRFHITCPPEVFNVHPSFRAMKGTIDLDDIRIYRDNQVMMYLSDTEAHLRRKKSIPAMETSLQIDDNLKKQIGWFSNVLEKFRTFTPEASKQKVCAGILKKAEDLNPYLTTEGLPSVKGQNAADMLILGSAMQSLMGGSKDLPADFSAEVKTGALNNSSSAPVSVEATAITVENIVPGKILYEENESGAVKYNLKNSGSASISGKVIVQLGYDIDSCRTVSETSITLQSGNNNLHTQFNVGPETFGREVKISFVSDDGKIKASGKEYFQVAKEFMRVIMHGTSRYQNLAHYFAHEPTDFGVQLPGQLDKYLSGQVQYKLSYPSRRGLINHRKNVLHWKQSFYQCRSFGGGAGYEEVRKHPDYILYGKNGQPEVDPIYGGLPNPFELAAPVERDPALRTKLLNGQKFLDLDITGWHHVCADFNNPEALKYGVKCIVDFMNDLKIDTIYLDDTPSIQPGYTWQGVYNTQGKSKQELAKMNRQISHIWHTEMRRLKPEIGSWCNGVTPASTRWHRSTGRWERTMGLGVDIDEGKDVNDEYLKDLTSYTNTVFLSEVQHCFVQNVEQDARHPDLWMKQLLEQRDFMIQKYGAGVIFGYIGVPNPPENDESNGFWPTISYFHAITLATQHHHILYGAGQTGLPSQQPFDQFMTRYSALLWARDVKTVSAEAAKLQIGTGKEKIFYKDFLYSRDTANGTDRIVHIVRKYPLARWDLNWSVPAVPLKDMHFEMAVPDGMKPVAVKCMRPYLSGESKEVVENKPAFKVEKGVVAFTLPAVHYYEMVAIRFEKL